MKKIISIFLLSIFAVFTLQAQLDRSVRPQPGPAPEIKLGTFETFTMPNGMQVIVVENRKVPVVSFQLILEIDPFMEGDAKGFVDFAGQLMREGTTTRSKAQIDEAIDFIGGSLSTTSTGIFAQSLTRHRSTLLELMADVLLNPTFPNEELQKRLTQTRSALQTIKTDGNAIARNLATTQIFGPNHPYGEVETEESLDKITVEKLRNYYKTYWKPNVAYMVVVGDINLREARDLMNRYFGSWQKGDVPTHSYPTPQAPAGRRVVFAEREGAVQSVVQVGYPIELPVGHPDAIKVSVMNSILGGGVFSGRLMQNLRETKGYTYGARSSLTNDRLVGRFLASTEVRNSVTDSTVVEILYEMNRLINEPVDEETLQLVKNFMSGTFARSLENPRTIANFAYNIRRFNLPADYYANYLKNLNAVTLADVKQMAARYLKPENSVVIVAGNISEVPETLERFCASGKVEFFDAFGRPITPPELEPVPAGVTLETVLDKYYNALGGKEGFTRVTDLKQTIEIILMGQTAVIKQYLKAPNFMKVETMFGGMVMQTQIFDGKRAVMSGMMGKQEFEPGSPEYETFQLQAIMNIDMNYARHGITKELEGIAKIDGIKAYRVLVTTPSGRKTQEFYDINTGLKFRSVTEMGSAAFADYQPVTLEIKGEKPGFFARLFGKKQQIDGYRLSFPRQITQQMGGQQIEMKITEITLNTGIEDGEFKIN